VKAISLGFRMALVAGAVIAGASLWGPAAGGPAYESEAFVKVGRLVTVDEGSFNSAVVFCPEGQEAIAGGVDTENVVEMVVTGSSPMFGRGTSRRSLYQKPKGTYPAATAWSASVKNNSTGPLKMRVSVTCVKK
jgi:hypothetical protein